MHLVTVTQPLKRGALLAVGSYLVDDFNAGQMLAAEPTKVQAQHADNPKPIHHLSAGLATARVLIIRAGGYGDLLFLAAAIRAFKQLYPGAHVAVACFTDYAAVLEHNPDVAEIIPYPVPLAIADSFDAIVPLENTVENETALHAVDCFLSELGVDYYEVPDEQKRCVYHATDQELATAHAGFRRKLDDAGKMIPRLGVQVVAGSLNRTYPHNLMAHLFGLLHGKAGWEVFVFGAPKSLSIAEQDRFVNLTARGLSFRASAAVLATCDVVLAPDSAIAHLAGALDLPCVALYGPFPHGLRTKYHPKTFAMHGNGPCAPCHHRGTRANPFPDGGPCQKSERCDVLASLAPQRVAIKLMAVYKAAQEIETVGAAKGQT